MKKKSFTIYLQFFFTLLMMTMKKRIKSPRATPPPHSTTCTSLETRRKCETTVSEPIEETAGKRVRKKETIYINRSMVVEGHVTTIPLI